MDLFNFAQSQHQSQNQLASSASHSSSPSDDSAATPLAEQMRPQNLGSFYGQDRFMSPRGVLRKRIESGGLGSTLIWGPPGTGKTTIVNVMKRKLKGHWVFAHASDLGTKKIKEIGGEARSLKLSLGQRTYLYVDEIHRLNKAQQDGLLGFVEQGDLVLVGTSTENPGYVLSPALVSRCTVIPFNKLSKANLLAILNECLQKSSSKLNISEDLKKKICAWADGDARKLLNGVENILSHEFKDEPTAEELETLLGQSLLSFNSTGKEHYELISAFIKSIRGSDPDAAIYYLARLIKSGEDPLFIARRLLISASEDVGNADPKAISVVVSAVQAFQMVGLPEGAINLAQATTYLASAPKSDRSYKSWQAAQEVVEETKSLPLPRTFQKGSYKNPHENEKSWLRQQYLPDSLVCEKYYEPKSVGYEKHIAEFLNWLKS